MIILQISSDFIMNIEIYGHMDGELYSYQISYMISFFHIFFLSENMI